MVKQIEDIDDTGHALPPLPPCRHHFMVDSPQLTNETSSKVDAKGTNRATKSAQDCHYFDLGARKHRNDKIQNLRTRENDECEGQNSTKRTFRQRRRADDESQSSQSIDTEDENSVGFPGAVHVHGFYSTDDDSLDEESQLPVTSSSPVPLQFSNVVEAEVAPDIDEVIGRALDQQMRKVVQATAVEIENGQSNGGEERWQKGRASWFPRWIAIVIVFLLILGVIVGVLFGIVLRPEPIETEETPPTQSPPSDSVVVDTTPLSNPTQGPTNALSETPTSVPTPAPTDEYDDGFSGLPDPVCPSFQIKVVYPNGGEIWERETPYTIRWEADDSYDQVQIMLKGGEGTGGGFTVAYNTANDGEFLYKGVPANYGYDRFRIIVRSLDGTAEDASDNQFLVPFTWDATVGELGSPTHLSPCNNAVFSHYPRGVRLRWLPMEGAVSYKVEVDWTLEYGGDNPHYSYETDDTNVVHVHPGAQLGAWRVWAIGIDGTEGPKSEWWYFDFTI